MTEPVTPTLPELAAVAATLRRSLDSSPSAEAFTVPATDARTLVALLDVVRVRSGRVALVDPQQGTLMLQDETAETIVDEIVWQACAEMGGSAADETWVRGRLQAALAAAPTPPYVHRLLDALLRDAEVLDFKGATVPADVRLRLDDAARAGDIRPLREV